MCPGDSRATLTFLKTARVWQTQFSELRSQPEMTLGAGISRSRTPPPTKGVGLGLHCPGEGVWPKADSPETHPPSWCFQPMTPTHKGALLPPFSHLHTSWQRERAGGEDTKEPTFTIFKNPSNHSSYLKLLWYNS